MYIRDGKQNQLSRKIEISSTVLYIHVVAVDWCSLTSYEHQCEGEKTLKTFKMAGMKMHRGFLKSLMK